MSQCIILEETTKSEFAENLQQRIKEATEKGMIVFFPPSDINIKSVGQLIKIATSIPQASAGPLATTVVSFNVEVNTPDISDPQTLYAKCLNYPDFDISGAAGGFVQLNFDPDTIDDPLLLTVNHNGAAPIAPGTAVTVAFYSAANDANFLQNEVISYIQIAAFPASHPRRLTIKKIARDNPNKFTLRWRIDKLYADSYTLDVTYKDSAGNDKRDLFRSGNGTSLARTSVSSDRLADTFELTNVATTAQDVIVSVVTRNPPYVQASIVLKLTP